MPSPNAERPGPLTPVVQVEAPPSTSDGTEDTAPVDPAALTADAWAAARFAARCDRPVCCRTLVALLDTLVVTE